MPLSSEIFLKKELELEQSDFSYLHKLTSQVSSEVSSYIFVCAIWTLKVKSLNLFQTVKLLNSGFSNILSQDFFRISEFSQVTHSHVWLGNSKRGPPLPTLLSQTRWRWVNQEAETWNLLPLYIWTNKIVRFSMLNCLYLDCHQDFIICLSDIFSQSFCYTLHLNSFWIFYFEKLAPRCLSLHNSITAWVVLKLMISFSTLHCSEKHKILSVGQILVASSIATNTHTLHLSI